MLKGSSWLKTKARLIVLKRMVRWFLGILTEQAQKAVIEGFSSALEKGDSISLVGFGSFKVVARAAREGRNPSTGEKMQIPASKAVKFTPSKSLKERVQ